MNITRTYSAGDKGRVRRLTNLSGAWVDVSPANNLVIPCFPAEFYDVETDITDPNKVYVVGEMAPPGVGPQTFYGIAVSDDAGVTWNQPYDLAGGDYTSLYFTPTPPAPFYKFYEVSVVDANTIYACGDSGWVVKSIDGGQSFNKCTQLPPVLLWGTAVIPPPPPLAIRSVTALHFITPLIGVVACYGNVFKTIDGGVTWIHLNGGLPIADSYATFGGIGVGIHISQDAQTIVCLNYSSSTQSNIVRSTDGGTTWVEVFQWAGAQGTSNISGLHLTWTDDLHLWGFSELFGRIFSVDAGATWSYLEIPHTGTPSKNDNAGHFFTNTNGFYSEGSDVYYTTNGGVTEVLSETAPYVVNAIWTKQVVTCYIVTDCTGVQEPFVTNSDLANYVGLTLQSCIDVPPLVRQYSNPPAVTNNTLCYKLVDCCDPTHITLITKPPLTITPAIPSFSGFTITFPLVYPGICWTITEESCQSNPIPQDPLIGAWWTGVYTVYNNCLSCVNGVNNPCAIPSDLYTLTSCCDDTIQLYIGIEDPGYPFPTGMVVQIPSIPELGENCWFVEKGTQGPPTISVNPAIDTIITYLDCDSSPCTCVTNWPNGCYCITITETDDCTGSAPWLGTIGEVFEDCPSCIGTCYLLEDCEGILDSIQTSNDLSAYVGQIIQLDNCDTCWTVSVLAPLTTCCWDLPVILTTARTIVINGTTYNIPTPGNVLTYLNSLNLGVFTITAVSAQLNRLCVTGNETYGDVTLTSIQQTVVVSPTCNTVYPVCSDSTCTGLVTANFTTCEECNPPALPTPFELHIRKVKPGYDTPGCSPEYTEKVLCTFAEGVFDQMAVKRYGITVCCDIDVDKWDIKRQLLELSAIYDPSLCVCLLPVPVPEPVCYPIEVPCRCITITILTGDGTFTYIDCDGISQIATFDSFNHSYICSKTAPTLTSDPAEVTYTITNTNIECTTDNFCVVPEPICYCWQINNLGLCEYQYRDCQGVYNTTILNIGISYLCSIVEPTQIDPVLCKIPTVINLGTCEDIPICNPTPCYCYSVFTNNKQTTSVRYTDCDGVSIVVDLPQNTIQNPYYICSRTIPAGLITAVELGNCADIAVCVPGLCQFFVINPNNTSGNVTYKDCLGVTVNIPVSFTERPFTICAQAIIAVTPGILYTDTNITCTG